MPQFDFECTNCGAITSDVLISLASIKENKNTRVSNLRKHGIVCKCGRAYFFRKIGAHGKSSVNWSSWQRDPKGK